MRTKQLNSIESSVLLDLSRIIWCECIFVSYDITNDCILTIAIVVKCTKQCPYKFINRFGDIIRSTVCIRQQIYCRLKLFLTRKKNMYEQRKFNGTIYFEKFDTNPLWRTKQTILKLPIITFNYLENVHKL